MNQKWKTVILALSIAVLILVAYAAYSTLSARYKPQPTLSFSQSHANSAKSVSSFSLASSKADITAPDFTVYSADGKKVKLSGFRGKPVVLNFWASSCNFCKMEMPDFNEVYQKEKNNVMFLFLDCVNGRQETQEIALAYLKRQGYSFPVYFDSDQAAVTAYDFPGTPTTYFIDKSGCLVSENEGPIEKSTLENGIAALESRK